MYCVNCGAVRTEGAAYCADCWDRLESREAHAGATGPELWAKMVPVPWRGGQVGLGILLVAIAVAPVALISLGAGGAVDRYDKALATWISVHLMGLVILGVVWRLGIYRFQVPISTLGFVSWRIPEFKAALLTAGTLGASLLFTVVYAAVVGLLEVDFLSPPEIPSDIAFPGAAAALTFQALAVATPITEEIFFRGFVFAGLIPGLGVGWAMVVSAAVFSAFHLSVGALVPVFVTGLLFAWLYRQTGSLWPGILAHAGQNALAVALEIYGV